jgi:chromosome segregation ATPase
MLNRRTFVFAMIGFLVVPPALARRRRGGNYSGRTMTRAELEHCVIQQETIDQLESDLSSSQAEISRLEAEVKASERRIETAAARVDNYSQASVDAFNSLLPQHDQLIKRYNSSLPRYNQLVSQQHSTVEAFNKACTAHPYYLDDMIYVLKKLGLYG